MRNHLKLFFATEREPFPNFASELLAETLDLEVDDIESTATREGWKSLTIHETIYDGTVESYQAWDPLSMPYETRMEMAFAHYRAEEEEHPLLDEAKADAAKLLQLFPAINFEQVTAAIYRARQYECVLDAALSLRLALVDAIQAVSNALFTDSEILLGLNEKLDNGEPCSFIRLAEDTRVAVLMHHFSNREDNPLSEFLPEELTLEPKEAAQ